MNYALFLKDDHLLDLYFSDEDSLDTKRHKMSKALEAISGKRKCVCVAMTPSLISFVCNDKNFDFVKQ